MASIRETLGFSPKKDEGQQIDEVLEKLKASDYSRETITESMRRLELALEDEGWRRLTVSTERDFTRAGLTKLMEISRAMYMNSPLIRRSVDVTTFYTWAQGANFKAKDDRVQAEVVEPQMASDGNRSELYGHQARILTHVDQMVDGNIFEAMFTNDRGEINIRGIPPEEITQIHHLNGDPRVVQFYRRVWTEEKLDQGTGMPEITQQEALYPDWRYTPRTKPARYGDIEVMWDAPVIHQKTGGLKRMQFGVPETYAAMDWARAYKKFLEDWHTLVASLARFAWKLTTKGRNVKGVKEKLNTTIDSNEEGRETNPAPSPGGLFVGTDDDDITPIPKTGATMSSDDAKPSRLMVASAMNLPDTFLSNDVDVGNFATSKTLDRPTELFMKNWQTLWSDFHADIFRYSIDARVRRGTLPGKVYEDFSTGMMVVEPAVDSQVQVTFPPILEHDMKSVVESVVMAATLQGSPFAGVVPQEQVSKLLMEAIGVEDPDAELANLDFEAQQELNKTVDAVERLIHTIKEGK